MPTLAVNKKARFDYEILTEYEAGIVLSGQEVKAVRDKQISLKGSYVTIDKNQEVFLVNASISAYKYAYKADDYDPTRTRKLLLNKKEIISIQSKLQQTGLTLLALSFYTKNKQIKVKIALAKGKKKHDKRADLKAKETKKDIQRNLKQRFLRG